MEAVIGYSCRINCAAAGNEKVSLAPDDEFCTNQSGVIGVNDLIYDLLCTTNRAAVAVRVHVYSAGLHMEGSGRRKGWGVEGGRSKDGRGESGWHRAPGDRV